MFHVGPRTDISKAAVAFGPDVSLDVDLDPFRDVLEADEGKNELENRENNRYI